MATITDLNTTDTGATSIGVINTNFDNLNNDKIEDDSTDTLTNKTLISPAINGDLSGDAILDEDDMASNSATKVPTQQSVKAYVDGTDTWHKVGDSGEPAFENGWTNHSSTALYGFVKFKKILNTVYIMGLVAGGTVDATICTLPAGYRPLVQQMLSTQQSVNNVAMRLDIETDGSIIQVSSGAGGNSYVSLFLSFITD